MSDSQKPEKVTWTAWLKSFTPLEAFLSCTFAMATIGFILALVARIMLPTSGCEDLCYRDFPKEFQPILARRFQSAPDDEILVKSRIGQSTRDQKIRGPRELLGGELPYLGSINYNDDDVACMMIIVSKRWCVTTATCFRSIDPAKSHSLMERNIQGALIGRHDTLRAVVHDSYRAGDPEHDIAAIESTTEFKLKKDYFFSFPTKRDELDLATGNMVVLIGWTSSDDDDHPVIKCWPSILPWDRRMNVTADVREKAGILVHGKKILYIISKNSKMIEINKLKEWVGNYIEA